MTSVYRKGDGIVQWNLERISSPGAFLLTTPLLSCAVSLDVRYALLLLNNERCGGPHFDVDTKFLKLWSNGNVCRKMIS